jgi:hypothetical protein
MGGWGSGNRPFSVVHELCSLLEEMHRFLRQDEEAPKSPQNSSHPEA